MKFDDISIDRKKDFLFFKEKSIIINKIRANSFISQ